MIEWASGLAGGCAGVLVGHPFDTVKVKLQTQDFRNPQYKGTFDCFAQTVKKNGLRGLYKGMASPMAGVGAINAVIFGVQGSVSRRFKDPDALRSQFYAGLSAGFVQSFIACPTELTKTRIQLQGEAAAGSGGVKYSGPLQCMKQILKKEGMRGLFKGQMITCSREVPGFGTYFLAYEWSLRQLSGNKKSGSSGPGPLAIMMAGGTAGAASWFITYPIDVIKTRLQSDGVFGKPRYSGVVDCFRTSIKEEGWGVLSRGLNSTLLRAFPTNAATFLVVSTVMKHMAPESDGAQSDTQQALEDIYSAAETILTAAEVAQQRASVQMSAIQKLKENHLKNFLPVVQAASEESAEPSARECEMGELAQSLASQDTVDMLLSTDQVGILDYSSHWVTRGGITTQSSKASECLMVNQEMLSHLL